MLERTNGRMIQVQQQQPVDEIAAQDRNRHFRQPQDTAKKAILPVTRWVRTPGQPHPCRQLAELLLGRMMAKIEALCDERDRLKKEEGGHTKGRVLGGRSW